MKKSSADITILWSISAKDNSQLFSDLDWNLCDFRAKKISAGHIKKPRRVNYKPIKYKIFVQRGKVKNNREELS